jgi:superfamily II DNA or RNA helicase
MNNCKIIISDEINCKIEGLDLDTRKYLVKKFKYVDPTAKYRPSYKLGRWDGSVSFFSIGGATYLSMLPKVLEYLEEKHYNIELEDLRTPISIEFEKITIDFWGDKSWPKGHRFENQPIRLRDDQVDVINKFLENPQCLQEIATGFGKTITTATLAKLCEKYGKTITIVPNKSLVVQTEEDFINCGLDVGVYYGDRKDLSKQHIICTWQSLNVLEKKSHDNNSDYIKFKSLIGSISALIVDEVHQATADVLKKLLTQDFSNVPIRWGLTGTIPKQDFEFESIRASLGYLINRVSAHELQEKGILANCQINIVQTLEYRQFKNYHEELKFLVTDEPRMSYISKLVNQISKSGNTLVLVDRIESGKFLQSYLNNLGEDVAFISGEVKLKDRKNEYDEIKTADNKIIIATYGVAAIGINIPRIFNMILLEPGKSFVRVIQSIGRGIRKADDKDHVEIWDITANTKYAKKHLTDRKKFYSDAKYPFSIEKITYT